MTTRIIISLPQELLDALNKFSQEQKYTRSECIRHAIRLLVNKKKEEDEGII